MMNTIKKYFVRSKFSKLLAAGISCGVLFCAGNAYASAEEDGMWAFREAYLATSNDTRTLEETLQFFGPAFHADVNGMAQVLRDGSLRMEGTINWTFTDLAVNETTQVNIPYYLEQDNDVMVLYAKRDGKWISHTLPGIPVGFANAIKTNDVNELKENMATIKKVELLKDSPVQRSMRITVDGPQAAELIRMHSAEDMANLTDEEKASQTQFIHRLTTALQTTDLVIEWTVDKTTWQTITTGINFTDLMRAYARGVLQEAANGTVVLSDDERVLFDALGYYSELHTYTSYIKGGSAITIPGTVKNTASEGDIFQDMKAEAASSVK